MALRQTTKTHAKAGRLTPSFKIAHDESKISLSNEVLNEYHVHLAEVFAAGRSHQSHAFWFCKRLFDVVLSSMLFVLLLPVLVITAIAIKIDSPGPVLFRQNRLGERLRLFSIYKFRTMYQGVKDSPSPRLDEVTGKFRRPTFQEDDRVTRVGKFLRSWSIDELPQILNILFGEMSFVGPRPLVLSEFKTISKEGLYRYSVPAGLSGLAQVRARGDVEPSTRFLNDIEYIQNLGLRQELWIILKTFKALRDVH